MEYISCHEGEEIDGRWLEKRIDEALLLGRKEGVELAEGVVPSGVNNFWDEEKNITYGDTKHDANAVYFGINEMRDATLSALSALKEKI